MFFIVFQFSLFFMFFLFFLLSRWSPKWPSVGHGCLLPASLQEPIKTTFVIHWFGGAGACGQIRAAASTTTTTEKQDKQEKLENKRNRTNSKTYYKTNAFLMFSCVFIVFFCFIFVFHGFLVFFVAVVTEVAIRWPRVLVASKSTRTNQDYSCNPWVWWRGWLWPK